MKPSNRITVTGYSISIMAQGEGPFGPMCGLYCVINIRQYCENKMKEDNEINRKICQRPCSNGKGDFEEAELFEQIYETNILFGFKSWTSSRCFGVGGYQNPRLRFLPGAIQVASPIGDKERMNCDK